MIENLGMRRITAKFVPRLLSVELKINRVQNQMRQVFNSAQSGSHFISKIIAGSDLASSDFFLFTKKKFSLKSSRFNNIGIIQKKFNKRAKIDSERGLP